MLTQIRYHLPSSLTSNAPLIRLCLRILFLMFFAIFFISLLHSFTDRASEGLWNPFKEGKSRQSKRQQRETLSNLPPQEDDDEILNKDPKYPRTRDWLYDHIYFSFYDGSRIYTNQEYIGGTVSRKPHHDELTMLLQVQSRAVKFLKNQSPGKYSKDHCNAIRYRIIPTVGIEADVTCNDTNTGDADRVSLVIPLKPPRVTYHHSVTPSTSVNIITPLKGRVETLKLFLTNLEAILRGNQMHVGLTVVYYEDDNNEQVERLLKESDERTYNLRTQFILLRGQQTFSRGRGLHIGVEKTTLPADTLFFCDVDVLFTRDFLVRCQANPVQGHQVYIPMVFSLYNPEFVYPLQKHKIPSSLKQLVVQDDHGYWRVWGHGMACLYKSDFQKIGGFDRTKSGWGGEDLAFVRKIINNGNYKVVRSLDPGLFHAYHNKDCKEAEKYYSCLKVKAANEASKQSLGFWYFKQTEKVSVYGALVEGNQPHYHDDYDDDLKDEAEVRQVTGVELVSEYKYLTEMLCALVLITVLGLDMFLMAKHFRHEQKLNITR